MQMVKLMQRKNSVTHVKAGREAHAACAQRPVLTHHTRTTHVTQKPRSRCISHVSVSRASIQETRHCCPGKRQQPPRVLRRLRTSSKRKETKQANRQNGKETSKLEERWLTTAKGPQTPGTSSRSTLRTSSKRRETRASQQTERKETSELEERRLATAKGPQTPENIL